MTAPGPWERLRKAARESAKRHGYGFEQRRTELLNALDDCPSPREADAAGEALDALAEAVAVLDPKVIDIHRRYLVRENARAILRRAGRLS